MICFSCTRAKSLAFFFRALLRSVIPALFILLSSVDLTIRHICGTNIPHVSERTAGVKSHDSFELFVDVPFSIPLFPTRRIPGMTAGFRLFFSLPLYKGNGLPSIAIYSEFMRLYWLVLLYSNEGEMLSEISHFKKVEFSLID